MGRHQLRPARHRGTCNPGPFEGEVATITGTMLEPGTVSLGGRSGTSFSSSLIGPWTFDHWAVPGVESVLVVTDDVGSFGGASRVAIRRGLAFDRDSEVSNVSLASEGEPLLESDVAIANTQSDETSFHTSTVLIVDDAYVEVSNSRDARARFVPNLLSGDEQYVSLAAFAHPTAELSTSRSVTTATRDFSGLEFPVRLGVVQFGNDGISVAWGELPSTEYEDISFLSAGDSMVYLEATQGWIESQQLSGLALDTSVPGFDPSWVDGVQQVIHVTLTRETAGQYNSSSMSTRLASGNASLRDLDREHTKQRMRRRAR